MAEEFRVLRPFEFHCQLISKGHRADGRTLDESRDLKLEVDAISTADSSSLVKLGNTSLVCGCTTQVVSSKKSGEENEDIISIKVELPPICSSPTGYRTNNTAQILTKALKNILDDTGCLDHSCLYIEELDSYWSIKIEVICLNYDGSLLDASLIAVLTALGSLKLKNSSSNIPERRLTIKSIPVCSSFAIIGEHFICDPNLEEETIAQTIFNVTTNHSDENLCHISKVGGKALTTSKLQKCIELSRKRASHVRQCLKLETNQLSEMDCT